MENKLKSACYECEGCRKSFTGISHDSKKCYKNTKNMSDKEIYETYMKG